MDLNILLDSKDRRHLYVQIYEYIRNEIRAGNIAAGERLPSTRGMGEKLHVARTTVELAYSQLEDEGYIASRQGSGAYVCEIGNIPDLGEMQREDSSSGRLVLHGVPQADRMGTNRKRSEGQESGSISAASDQERRDCAGEKADGVIDFSPRRIDMSEFPYPTWRRIMRNILSGDRSDLFGRGDPQGDYELRETIAHYLHLSRGCRCSAEQIVIGAGGDYLMLLLSMILGEKRRVGMESPTYSRMAKILDSAHEAVVPVPCDDSGMSADALESSDCDLAYVMPARQYPMGISMPYSRRAQLLQWAASPRQGEELLRRECSLPETASEREESGMDRCCTAQAEGHFIIEDDYDSEFRYRGHPFPSLQSQDPDDRVIYMGTFSKTIAPGMRVSYMILPRRLLKRFHQKAGTMSCTVSRMDQAFLNEFIRDGYYERYLNRMRNRYRAKHDLMVELLSGSRLMNEFELRGQGAGLHLLLVRKEPGLGECLVPEMSSPAGMAASAQAAALTGRNIRIEEELEQKARAAGVKVHPMSHLYLPSGLPPGQKILPAVMLGYASLDEDSIRRGIALLERAWEK